MKLYLVATIKYLNNPSYTITNEDGAFIIKSKKNISSFEIRYLGYETKTFTVESLKSNSKIYLTENVSSLSEVHLAIKKDKDYAYNLLNSLNKKYKANSSIHSNKVFLVLNSEAQSVPIEHVEGFYTSTNSLSKGIETLDVKSGRFGQNKDFPFYSLE
ncbi:MAG: hypothetical protein V3U80_02345 [Flavobacteriaceae bacterium]